MHVNLLPSSFVWKRLARKRIYQWLAAFGVVGFLFLAANSHLALKWWIGRYESQAMHAAVEPIRELDRTRVELAKQSVALMKKIKQVKAIVVPDRTTSFLGLLSRGVNSDNGDMQIQEMQIVVVEPQKEVPNGTKSSQSTSPQTAMGQGDELRSDPNSPSIQYQMTLRGISSEGESISNLVEELQKSMVFPKIELRSTQERFVAERTIQEFHLEGVGHE